MGSWVMLKSGEKDHQGFPLLSLPSLILALGKLRPLQSRVLYCRLNGGWGSLGFLTCELNLCQQNSGRSRVGSQGKVFKHKERNEPGTVVSIMWG